MKPERLIPSYKDYVWGGTKLHRLYRKGQEGSVIAESWEASCHPDGETRLTDGRTLRELVEQNPEVLGTERPSDEFPVLIKFIDARTALSLQVHPDDETAARMGGEGGKSEMWYIIDAKPGAYLYAGFKEHLTKEEYYKRIADGTICDALARHEVHTGDVFYLPAGRIHAIGKGVLLAEVQQTSDITYRIYDYGRPGLDGKPRELHTDLAAQALDYTVYQNYRNAYKENIDMANICLDTEHFSVRVLPLNHPMHRNMVLYDSFIIITCVSGECAIQIRSTKEEIALQEGFTCFIPAAIADYDIVPIQGEAKLLEAYINNKPRTTWQRIVSQFMHLSGYDI